jgi:poly-gamma-glutamate synthesis protein (capsule biosynthesis protein)
VPTKSKSADELRRKAQWVLKADPGHAAHLADTGIDIVALGNNHAMDYGVSGLDQMKKELNRRSLLHTGAGDRDSAYRAAVYTSKRARVGMVSALAFMTRQAQAKCSPASSTEAGVATLSFGGVIGSSARSELARWVANERRKCDLLVVGVHWGIEKQTLPTPYQVALGRALVDAGADVVWGHHPHVLQGAELYRGKPIFYSLGNLISPLGGPTSLVRLTYQNGKFSNAEWHPARIQLGRTVLASGNDRFEAFNAISKLCRELAKRYPNKQSQPLAPQAG